MIEIDKVSFGYAGGQETLKDVSLCIRQGECVLLCGESGCGKTTVTRLINGLIPHFMPGGCLEGSVKADRLPVADTRLYELAEHIGSVFQNPKSQFFNLDTDSELAFGLENEGVSPERMKARIDQTVEKLRLWNLSGRNIFSLSGGEKQSLAFASVYAMEPAIFVLDEPTANLDGEAVWRLREQLEVLKRQGHTVVIAEHRLFFLEGLIDRAFYFKEGRLLYSFTGRELFGLSGEERIRLGLRSTRPVRLSLPAAEDLAAAGKEAEENGPAGKNSGEQGRKEQGLVVEKLTCGYKKQPAVFTELSFCVRPGEVLAITGPNGAGKTTLTRCLCGLMKERAGSVRLDGRPLKGRQRRRESFLVMQDVNHQLFYDSVRGECEQAMGEAEKAASGPEEEAGADKIRQVLKEFDLLSFEESHPMALSGGQKQRLAVAAAMLSGKRVLIFDEPTSGLDYAHMTGVCSVVRRLAAQGHIVLVVSHDREFMQSACDRVLELG